MVKKLKVTRRVQVKVPWYEKPPLLFGVIGGLLLISGIVMAQLSTRTTQTQSVLGSGADSLASKPLPAAEQGEGGLPEGLSAVEAVLPAAVSGQVLPPLAVDTRQDAAFARARLRAARDLEPLAAARALGEGRPAFAPVEVSRLLEALAGGTGADLWDRLPFEAEFDPQQDIELQRDAQGRIYLAGYVSSDVAAQLAARGPELQLPPAPETPRPPSWQIWRKAPAPPVGIFRGSVISLFPELHPEARAYVALPLDRARPMALRTVRGSYELPTEVLQIEMQ